MAIYVAEGGPRAVITDAQVTEMVRQVLDNVTDRSRMLVIPPDMTRSHSGAGPITEALHREAGAELFHVLPALGTHEPMSPEQIRTMYGSEIPLEAFKVHDFRHGVELLGHIPAEYVHSVSEGVLQPIIPDYDIPIQISERIVNGGYTSLISVGQVVPHEVMGMANGVKNILVGTAGPETINKSHFIGAAYGMERMMGHSDTPGRRVLNRAHEEFLVPFGIVYILTVIGTDESGEMVMRGFFAGDDLATFERAAALSRQVNIRLLETPLAKAVVYVDPSEFKSTWLSNKSIYRTRMAMADDGELLVLAPGVEKFGEDAAIDALIRKYGYHGTPATLDAVKNHADIRENLSAAAHLIHGSSEGRFRITYATDPERLTKEEVRGVGFEWMHINEALEQYPIETMREGFNDDLYFVRDPALGLWALKEQFETA